VAAEQGFEDLCSPIRRRYSALGELALRSVANPDGAPIVMVDCVEHLDAIESVLGAAQHRSGSASTSTPAGGAWRANQGRAQALPVHSVEQAVGLAREIERRPQIELDALMAYEGQIAGVGGRRRQRLRAPRSALCSALGRRAGGRRAAIVAALGEFVELEIVTAAAPASLD